MDLNIFYKCKNYTLVLLFRSNVFIAENRKHADASFASRRTALLHPAVQWARNPA